MAEGPIREGSLVVPGHRLFSSEDHKAGNGTYVGGEHILAAVVGVVKLEGNTVHVTRDIGSEAAVPQPGDTVTCKVTRITPLSAHMDILCVGDRPLSTSFPGVIRQQDVRAVGDPAEILKSFRPGDIVRAEVLSLGDARSFYLSTAKNELGVIYAQSEAGYTMVAVSWQEMQCPKTKAREFRKVAKVL